jgi:hypothetical protein
MIGNGGKNVENATSNRKEREVDMEGNPIEEEGTEEWDGEGQSMKPGELLTEEFVTPETHKKSINKKCGNGVSRPLLQDTAHGFQEGSLDEEEENGHQHSSK